MEINIFCIRVMTINIGNKVKITNDELNSYDRRGVIEDFENQNLRGNDCLVLVKFHDDEYEWFFGKDFKLIGE